MLKAADNAEKDRFRITTHKGIFYKFMQEAGILTQMKISQAQEQTLGRKLSLELLASLDWKWNLICQARLDMLHKQWAYSRGNSALSLAIRRRLALAGPMLLIVLQRTLLTTLLTFSVAVILCAFVVCAISSGLLPGTKSIDLGPRDVLAATATYAAVIVVFVG